MCTFLRLCCIVFLYVPFSMVFAAVPDFTSATGLAQTCAVDLRAEPASTPQAQQAWVICRDIATAKRLLRLADHFPAEQAEKFSVEQLGQEELRVAFAALRDELRTTRLVLEKIHLRSKDDGLLLVPATWGSDLNGDGTLTPGEQYAFAIPRRQSVEMAREADTDQYYQEHYQLDARFRIDQSDLQWMLGYHYFLEASAELSAAFDNSPETPTLRVYDPHALSRAHVLLLAGLKSSDKLRNLLLAETDDEDEWIAHPAQHNSVFPIALSERDFRTWQTLISHLLPVLEGKQLLAGTENGSMFESLFSTMCPGNQGLNVASLFHRKRHEVLVLGTEPVRWVGCQPITVHHPASPLLRYLASPVQRGIENESVGMAMLRTLLWVN